MPKQKTIVLYRLSKDGTPEMMSMTGTWTTDKKKAALLTGSEAARCRLEHKGQGNIAGYCDISIL